MTGDTGAMLSGLSHGFAHRSLWFAHRTLFAGVAFGVLLVALPPGRGAAAPHHPEDEADYLDRIEVIAITEPCQPLAVYRQPEGVELQPGKSVTGTAVTPADLGGAPAPVLPETVTLDILIEPRETLPVRLEGKLGTIRTNLVTGATTVLGRAYDPAPYPEHCP